MIKQLEETITNNLAEYTRSKNIKKCVAISQVYDLKKAYFIDKISSYDDLIMIKHKNITYIEDILKIDEKSKIKLNEFKTFCNCMLHGYDQKITINQIKFIKNINISYVDEIQMSWPEIGLLFTMKNTSIDLRLSCFKSGNLSLASNAIASNEHKYDNLNECLEKMITELKSMMLKEVGLGMFEEDHPEVQIFKNKSFDEVITEQFSKFKFDYINTEKLIRHVNTKINKDFFDINTKKSSLLISLNNNENKKVALSLYDKIMKEPYRNSTTMDQLINLIIFYCGLSNKSSKLILDVANLPNNYTKLNKLIDFKIYSFYFEDVLIIDIDGHEKFMSYRILLDNCTEYKTASLDELYTYFLKIVKNHINETINNDEPLTSSHLELYKMIII